MPYLKKFIVLLLLPIALVASDPLPKAVTYGTEGDWVRAVEPTQCKTEDEHQGEIFLLYDKQIYQIENAEYLHMAKKYLNSSAIEADSKIEIMYDPSFQKVVLHKLQIHRDGEVIDQTRVCPKKILKEGFAMHQLIYQDYETLVLFIEDLREGDVVEVSYTTSGVPSFFQGYLETYFPLGGHIYVEKLYNRLVAKDEDHLKVKLHNSNVETSVFDLGEGLKEWIWENAEVEPFKHEHYCPSWHFPLPWVQVTNYEDWGSIGKLFANTYRFSDSLPEGLLELIENWKTGATSQEDLLEKAVNFVQNEVRYLSLHEGEEGWKPHHPNEVFKRRYGDCKDKTALLIALFDTLGTKSFPILVHTGKRGSLGELLPSLHFNHVFVGYELEGKTYYIDPTSSLQKDKLTKRFLPPYRLGLPLTEDSDGLASIPFDLFDGKYKRVMHCTLYPSEEKAILNQRIEFSGYEADRCRHYQSTYSKKEIKEMILEHLENTFEDVKLISDPKFTDEGNTIWEEFSYQINEFGDKDEDAVFYSLPPLHLDRYLDTNINLKRTSPLSINYPCLVEEEITLEVENGRFVDVEKEKLKVQTPYFDCLIKRIPLSENLIQINAKFETHTEAIAKEDLSEMKKEFKKIALYTDISLEVALDE